MSYKHVYSIIYKTEKTGPNLIPKTLESISLDPTKKKFITMLIHCLIVCLRLLLLIVFPLNLDPCMGGHLIFFVAICLIQACYFLGGDVYMEHSL